jgi:positive regulator of sigma E activity
MTRGNGEADLTDAMAPGAAVTVERLAGIMLISFGLIYLVLLGDILLSAFFARALFTTALVMRILVLGAVFTSAVLFGLLLNRPSR